MSRNDGSLSTERLWEGRKLCNEHEVVLMQTSDG